MVERSPVTLWKKSEKSGITVREAQVHLKRDGWWSVISSGAVLELNTVCQLLLIRCKKERQSIFSVGKQLFHIPCIKYLLCTFILHRFGEIMYDNNYQLLIVLVLAWPLVIMIVHIWAAAIFCLLTESQFLLLLFVVVFHDLYHVFFMI